MNESERGMNRTEGEEMIAGLLSQIPVGTDEGKIVDSKRHPLTTPRVNASRISRGIQRPRLLEEPQEVTAMQVELLHNRGTRHRGLSLPRGNHRPLGVDHAEESQLENGTRRELFERVTVTSHLVRST